MPLNSLWTVLFFFHEYALHCWFWFVCCFECVCSCNIPFAWSHRQPIIYASCTTPNIVTNSFVEICLQFVLSHVGPLIGMLFVSWSFINYVVPFVWFQLVPGGFNVPLMRRVYTCTCTQHIVIPLVILCLVLQCFRLISDPMGHPLYFFLIACPWLQRKRSSLPLVFFKCAYVYGATRGNAFIVSSEEQGMNGSELNMVSLVVNNWLVCHLELQKVHPRSLIWLVAEDICALVYFGTEIETSYVCRFSYISILRTCICPLIIVQKPHLQCAYKVISGDLTVIFVGKCKLSRYTWSIGDMVHQMYVHGTCLVIRNRGWQIRCAMWIVPVSVVSFTLNGCIYETYDLHVCIRPLEFYNTDGNRFMIDSDGIRSVRKSVIVWFHLLHANLLHTR